MKYTLMHKEIPVITLEYNENALAFTDVLDIYNPACFPLGTMDPDKQLFETTPSYDSCSGDALSAADDYWITENPAEK